MGRGIDSRNRVWNWIGKLHRLVGRHDNPMPTWFLAHIAGLSYRHRSQSTSVQLLTLSYSSKINALLCPQSPKLRLPIAVLTPREDWAGYPKYLCLGLGLSEHLYVHNCLGMPCSKSQTVNTLHGL